MDVYEAVRALYARYRGEKCIYGRSEEGRALFAFFVGRRDGVVGVSQYAIHAREWICSHLALEHIRRGVRRGGVWVLPLTDPDGALLATHGVCSVRAGWRERLLQINGGEDFSLWKANARAVDLNVNFPAKWGSGAQNVRSPAPQNYIGSAPLCARESAALARFTLRVAPAYTLSWHTKGEEVYWRFFQTGKQLARDEALARKLSRITGYQLRETPNSAGGYKDWCIRRLRIPAFTIEAGQDKRSHPLGREALADLLQHTQDALLRFQEEF